MRIAPAEGEDSSAEQAARGGGSRVTPGLATAPGPTLAKALGNKVSWFPAGGAPSLLRESGVMGASASRCQNLEQSSACAGQGLLA